MGEATHHVRQQWEPHDGERLYGLGQHQQGLVDIKGTDLELRQYNGEIFIPLLVSSRGYGILWDNTSLSRFGRTEPPGLGGDPGDGERALPTGRETFKAPPRANTSSARIRRAISRSTSNTDADPGMFNPGLATPSSITGARAGFRARTSRTST